MRRSALLVSALLLGAIPVDFATASETRSELQGFSAERLERIAPVMKDEIAKGTFPGDVALIARNGQLVYFEAHGFIDAGKTRPITKDAVFRAFSMTKPLTSVAAMALVEQGKMSLRDPIWNWMPEFKEMKVIAERQDERGRTSREAVPAKRPITVQDLLRHTVGVHVWRQRAVSGAEGSLREGGSGSPDDGRLARGIHQALVDHPARL